MLGRYLTELLLIVRFAIVGVAAAVVHMSSAMLFLYALELSPMYSNVNAFFVAFLFSFVGQYFWTFKSQANKKKALILFFAVSLAGFAANNILLFYMLKISILEPQWAIILSAAIIPMVTYTMSRLCVF